jgi:hypothetical protein
MCCTEYRILSRYKKGLSSDDSVWGKKKFFAPSSWDVTPRDNSSWKRQKRSEAVYVYTDESFVASLVQKQRSCCWVVLPPLLLSSGGHFRVVREPRFSVVRIARLEAYFPTTG